MIKIYKYDDWDTCADASFKVDLTVFKKEHALAFLQFYTWDWDEDKCIIEQALRKCAYQAIMIATQKDHNTVGVKRVWNVYSEAYPSIDGSLGIELLNVGLMELEPDNMTLKIEDYE
ncbi:hypothetical protein JCM19294_1152 [Nonlabens tegetincola]|uniref:Uncharacterized protein n=1 Tax=Nonlabens tegetincola TaxID=323273 RepID=A0A090Q527_9FLAO|nr:DUF2528 family protein [Nonlabens tegetincola]GAK96843.1 hypothetical protein JCM19294_1152 [Nonlabens tegetincola]